MLLCFLQNAPKLENLVVKKLFKRNSKRKEVGNSRWIEPQITPTCISTNLKIFEFKGVQNIKVELDFIRYIIKSSKMLEKVKIFTPKSKGTSEKKSIVETKLLKWSKKSSVLAWEINSV
ncbi:F-box/FBD/LRR-repeat protein At5g56570-like [Cicer arietinum]